MSHDELAFGENAPLLEIMTTMRAMRRLKPDPVPRELLEKLVTAASYGPSGSNSQTYSFVVVTDRDVIARIAPLWQRIADFYLASQTLPPHMSEAAAAKLVAAVRYQADHFADTPALVIACYEMRTMVVRMMRNVGGLANGLGKLGPLHSASLARNMSRSRARAEAGSIYPGVQNLLLMARALGLAATLTTWHAFFEQEFKDILGIPRHVNVHAVVPVGWPAGKFGPVTRLPAADAIHWQRW